MERKAVSGMILAWFIIGMLITGFRITSVVAQIDPIIRDPTVQISPESPSVDNEINVTVSFWILEALHFVVFGNLTQLTLNMFYVDVIFDPIELPIVGPFTYSHTYSLGKLSAGSYEFAASINLAYVTSQFVVRGPGDLNGDNTVDGKDIAVVAQAFGSYPSHPRWNPRADLNQDSRIEGKDIALVAKNFGKTYP